MEGRGYSDALVEYILRMTDLEPERRPKVREMYKELKMFEESIENKKDFSFEFMRYNKWRRRPHEENQPNENP